MESSNKKKRASKCKYCRKNVSNHFKEYCRNTSIHGFNYFGEDRPIFEKIWWLVSITLCICFCGTLIYKIILKYSYFPVIVTFSMKESRLQKMPFPAVTICPRAKISQEYFNLTEYYIKLLNKEETTSEGDKLNDMAAHICEFYPSNKTNTIEEKDFINFLNDSKTNILHYCQYLYEEIPCSNIMTPILTEDGICYSFNIMDKNDVFKSNTQFIFDSFQISNKSNWNIEKGYFTNEINTYPRRALRTGLRNQLLIVLKTRNSDIEYQCAADESGYRVSLHLPSDIPEVPENHFSAPLKQRIIAAVTPHTIQTSEGVKNFSPTKRDCYFESERQLKFFKIYSRFNCMLECKTNFTLKECGCVGFHMPREAHTPICFQDKLYCAERALDKFSIFNEDQQIDDDFITTPTSYNCDCKPTCTDISYNVDLSYNNMVYDILNKTFKEEVDYENYKYTTLTIYFKNEHVETKERNEIYGLSDVISNFGGLLGLFTGFSILSFLEILYFISLRFWGNVRIYGTWINPNNT